MKIACSMPLSPRPVQTGATPVDRGAASFADILAQLGLSAASDPDGAAARSAVVPEIGETATAFAEAPIILLTASLSGEASTQEARTVAQVAARIAEALDEVARFRTVSEAPLSQTAALRPAATSPSEAAAANAVLRPTLSAAAGVPGASGHPASVAPRAEGNTAKVFEGIAREAGKMAHRSAQGFAAGSSTPFQTALVTTEQGLRLVVRLPAWSDDEHAELSQRLAELFGRMGRTPPELLIYSPAPSGQGD